MQLLSDLDFIKTTANIATLLFALFIGTQLLLAVGILPISIAWGGRQTELTLGLRLASVVAAIILSVFIVIVRYRAGLIGGVPAPTVIRIAAWLVTGFMALNTLGNLASVNNTEKLLFGPITLLLTIACFIIALSNAEAIA